MSGQSIDRQATFTGTKEVAEALAFDEKRLSAWLEANVAEFRGPLTARQFKGGQSNPTYMVESASGKYVLRRKPPGKLLPSAHAVDREFKVISALHSVGFPVARPVVLCQDDDVVGTMFYLMDCVEGRVYWTPDLPDCDPAERTAIYDVMNATIARLHGIDFEAVGLGDFGKPAGYVARQIKRWSQQYRASETREVAEMERLIEWLPGAMPPDAGASIVHGDFRLDNMILHPSEPKVLAVLDWELATLGDPIGDFTYHLMQWHMPPSRFGSGTGSLVGLDLAALGIPSMEAYVARYCERTGRDGIANLDFYFAYNFFRLAAILQGILGRVRDGTATNENAAAMETQVGPLAEAGWSFAERAGARR
jgi:aminoglycoside phosphotransferase (APT) family kinase protein